MRSVGPVSTMRPRYITATRVGEVAHHAEVVRDEQVGEPELVLQVGEQIQDLRLDRHVERRGGLVADQQRGLDGERAGDADALALAAGELVRDSATWSRVEADAAHRARPRARVRSLMAAPMAKASMPSAMASRTREARIEGGARVLHDDLDLAPVGMKRSRARARQLDASEPDVAAGGLDELQDARARPWSCRNRIRRPAPASRPGRS